MRLEKDNILYGSRVKTQILNYEFESKKKYILLEKNEVICIDSYTHSFWFGYSCQATQVRNEIAIIWLEKEKVWRLEAIAENGLTWKC